MRYLIFDSTGVGAAEALEPEDLVDVERGNVVVLRCGNDTFEFAEVTSRSVDDPNNSLDEVRYDQAINGRIYEVSNWRPVDKYVRGDQNEPGGPGEPTIISSQTVEESMLSDSSESEDARRQRILEQADRKPKDSPLSEERGTSERRVI